MNRCASALLTALAIALSSAPAGGAPPTRGVDLELKEPPSTAPTTLSMRVAGQDDASDDSPAVGSAAAPAPAPQNRSDDETTELAIDRQLRQRLRESDVLGQRRALSDKIIFRGQFGFGIDGGEPTGLPLIGGETLVDGGNYDSLRPFTFGNIIVGTRGLGVANLNTYLASSYKFYDPRPSQVSAPIPTVQDTTDIQSFASSGYIEIGRGFFKSRFLRPLYIRTGRQFQYHPALVHFDGTKLGYKAKGLSATLFVGFRVERYGGAFSSQVERPIAGAGFKLDLFELRKTPLVLSGSALSFDDSSHLRAAIALRWSENVLVRASLRTLDGRPSHEALRVRARLSEVTTVTVEFDNRNQGDWIYDLLSIRPSATGARTYLNLGLPRSRARLSVRAGTVFLRNIDVLVRASGAVEYDDELAPSGFHSTYGETGAAVDVRVRRSLRLGTSVTGRVYSREERIPIPMTPFADPLPEDNGTEGERSFVEGGLFLDYSLGSRQFSARGEFYGRRVMRKSTYIANADETADLRSGGRFSIEGWATERLRLKGEYDVSLSGLDFAPEITGVKSLRVLVEGSF